jgi:Tfp pilus assembly protein PilX
MKQRSRQFNKQSGFLLIIAVIMIMVMGIMGLVIAYMMSGRSMLGGLQYEGLNAFYLTESGLEIGTRLLTMPSVSGTPSRITCSGVTGNAAITDAALNDGTFTITTTNSSPVYAASALSSSITAASGSITVSSASGFAPSGRLMIEKEAVDYVSKSGNTFSLITRGVGGTLAASHGSGAPVSQYQCSIDVQGGIPSIAAPRASRELQWNIPLQDGWLVGTRSGSNFFFSNWNRLAGITWTDNTVSGSSATRANLNGVSMISNVYGWAAGDMANNAFTLMRWNGSSWTLNALSGACSGQNLLDVSMVTATEGYAVGVRYRNSCASGGSNFRYTVLKWNGSSWTILTPSTTPSIPADNANNQTLNGVSVIDSTGSGSANVGFAVGVAGKILQYNGSNWVATSSPVSTDLNGVYTVSASEAWAVGAGGVILRWNGSSWSSVSSPTTTA